MRLRLTANMGGVQGPWNAYYHGTVRREADGFTYNSIDYGGEYGALELDKEGADKAIRDIEAYSVWCDVWVDCGEGEW